MRAYIDSICNRKPPSKAPQVRPTKSALLLLSHQEAKRRQLGDSQADGSISALKRPHPQPRAAAAKWPLKAAPSVRPPPRPLACRSPSPLAHDVLARTPAASSVAAAESPWHPLFTSASQSPATSPRQQQRPARRASEEESEAGVTREEYWPMLARSLEADRETPVAVAAHGDRRLYDETAEDGEGGHRKAGVTHASAAERGGCAKLSPTRAWRSAWTPWHPPSHKVHQDLVRSDAASPFQTHFRLRYPSSSSYTSPAPHARSEMEPPRAPRASAARPSMTSGTPSNSNLAALSRHCPTSPARAVDLSEPPRWCHRVSAPQQQPLARVHERRESYSSSAHCTTDADVIADTQRRPDSPPCRSSLSSLFSSGFFSRGPEAAMHRRAGRYSTAAHRAGNPCARFPATAQSAASSLTESQQASQPRPGADYRCRDVNNCSLRDLQEGLCTRLQRRLHDLETSPSSSTSPMDWKAAAQSTASAPLLADTDATLRLWRDTRRALRQQVMHRSAIHDVQRSTPLKGQWPDVEEGVVMDDVVRRILAERAASRAYLLAGAAAANREERTR
ncbi:hypothetical protein, unknown function [Leishmania infantum JPCM5]|uniref:Uncharacterized protein n=2 Tax=Leishmania infantum TaxID=5671 RepID=A4HXT9_LEIIN|nr:hypothetical protein, unknown function [Leishmania infantum JPCM5]CAC9480384.1 hypothetical_protein_-_conserved [Leishmania infantum]CAM67117.1 hypothetical protein, unknown function [Leishmania infantum JPCM5]SUZ40990.1 hypothetical_protein_-_conserved [Leishmania infantum]|eukprot:XP_001464880.1 hypothetical protein, unknown function [Leishmania infantum JPCM5]